MTRFYSSDNIVIYCSDVLDALREMPSESVHCAITSPPYFALRSYLPDGHPDKAKEIGLEASPAAWIDKMVEVFGEVKRVLRRDGLCFVNCGDAYARGGGDHSTGNADTGIRTGRTGRDAMIFKRGSDKPPRGLPAKNLLMMPARLAIALQDDGWILRSDIAWIKRAPMPESCKDRPTKSWEHLFMFAKSGRYYYDAEAVKESAVTDPESKAAMMFGSANGKNNTSEKAHAADLGHRWEIAPSRNMRDVLWLSPEPSNLPHYAAYPRALVRPCVRAGTSERGCCGAMVKKLKIRADLSESEREMVYRRLGAKGVL